MKSVKRCLKKVIGNARLTYEELLTVQTEIEGVLNSRPLTYFYDEATEPLTPSHLALGKRLLTPAESCISVDRPRFNPDYQEMQNRESHLEMVLKHFWNRWRKEYLTELREHHRCVGRRGKSVQVGDMVCVYEDKMPRQRWKVGKVTRLIVGRDGNVRAAEIRVCDKVGKVIEMRRPLQKLFPFEVENVQENEHTFPVTFIERAGYENTN